MQFMADQTRLPQLGVDRSRLCRQYMSSLVSTVLSSARCCACYAAFIIRQAIVALAGWRVSHAVRTLRVWSSVVEQRDGGFVAN